MTSSTYEQDLRGSWLLDHPIASVAVLEVLFVSITLGGAFVVGALVPGLPGFSTTGVSRALVVAVIDAALVLAIIGALRWWGAAGFTPRSQWRDLRLYWLPAVLVFAPFIAGIKMPSPVALALLVLGYLLSCVYEEGFFRGIALVLLSRLGLWPAVLISSTLFGLTHLSNQVLRGVSFLIVLQALGAAVRGIGYAALRLRTNTIWPLIVIHALHDVTLQMGHLPIAMVEAPIDTLLAIYGVILLRGHGSQLLPHAADVSAGPSQLPRSDGSPTHVTPHQVSQEEVRP
jgi:membrane protease YdiL (CAAX protease family)